MDFFHNWQGPLLWASGLSLFALVATILCVPWVITRLPCDYFVRSERVVWRVAAVHPFLALIFSVLKNILGILLVILGVIMLVTPGQGILTLLIGLLLMNFPGKYRLERWLVLRPGILRAMNWVRRRQGYIPFDTPGIYSEPD
jgi:hypothetical protein